MATRSSKTGCLRAVGLVLGLAWAGPARADLGEIRASGALRVLVAADEQPEMFAVGGDHAGAPGLEREMLEGFARAERLKLQVVAVKRFDEMIPRLKGQQGDVLVGIVATASRERLIAFSSETLPVRHVVVTRSPRPPILSLDELRRARVGVVSGTTWADQAVAAGVPQAQLERFWQLPEAMEALRSGAIQATVLSVSDLLLEKRRDPTLEAGLFLGAPARAGWGVRHDDRELLAALNRHLERLRTSPAWGRLVVKYFGEQALSFLGRARRE